MRHLVNGPAPPPSRDPAEALEVVARFPGPHEAYLARGVLASRGIAAIVNHAHTPFVSSSAWVHLCVALADAGPARELLEEGCPPGGEGSVGSGDAGAAASELDDMGTSRRARRMLLARWFLYAEAIAAFLAGLPVLVGSVVAIVPLGLALWSKREPRLAFSIALAFQALVTSGSVALGGPLGLLALIPTLAVYMAWLATGE